MVKISKIIKGELCIKHNFSYENSKYIKNILDDSVSEINKSISCIIKKLQINQKLNSVLLTDNGELATTRINYCTDGNITIGIQFVCFLWIICYLYLGKEDKNLTMWGYSLFRGNSEWPQNAISPLCTDPIIDNVNNMCKNAIIFSLLHEIGHASNPPSIGNVNNITGEIEYSADDFAKRNYNNKEGIIISFLCLEIYNSLCTDNLQLLCTTKERLCKLEITVPDFDTKAKILKDTICNNLQLEPSCKEENIR